MTALNSCQSPAAPLEPMGNGKMLAYFSDAALQSFFCGYTAPSFFSLIPDTAGGYYESESERISPYARRHRIWHSVDGIRSHLHSSDLDPCDLLVSDCMAADEGLFGRVVEGKSPFRWRLELPDYVNRALQKGYPLIHGEADALFCTIPSGLVQKNSIPSADEACLTVYLCGDLHFEEDGQVLVFEGGRGYMLCVDSKQPMASLKRADQLLKAFRKGSLPSEWSFGGEPRKFPYITPCKNDQGSAKLNDAAVALLAMQSAEGFILADAEHPYAAASDLPLLTAALIKIGRCDDAWKMILCWAANMGSAGEGIPPLLASGAGAALTDRLDGNATAAFLLAAMLLIEADGTHADADQLEGLFRKLRKAFTLTMNELTEGMLPFSVFDRCFEAGMISRDCLFHGSATATVTAIAAAEHYVAYCRETGRKIARESERYLTLLADARASFERHFASKDGLYRLNSPEMAEKTRRPRFMKGICPNCSATAIGFPLEQLELSRSGRYRCRRCLSVADKSEPLQDSPYPSLDATAYAALWMPPPASANALRSAARFFRSSLEGEAPLQLRSTVSDAMLLAAVKRTACQADEDIDLLREVLTESLSLSDRSDSALGLLPGEQTEANTMKGTACRSASLAAYILAHA